MPARKLVAQLMAEVLSVIAHPERFRIIEELSSGEKCVDELVQILMVSQPAVSQHLSALRSKGLVTYHRRGRYVFYSLRHIWIGAWLLDGMKLLEKGNSDSVDISKAVKSARKLWGVKDAKS